MDVVHVAALHKALDVRIFQKECRTLAAAGHRVRLLVGDPPEPIRDGVIFLPLPDSRSRNHLLWLGRSLWNVWRSLRGSGARVVHFHESDLIPAMLLLKLGGRTIIYDVHEDAPRQVKSRCRSLGLSWLGPVAGWAYGLMERLAMRAFDAFVCATPTIAQRFPADRTAVVCNYPDLTEFEEPEHGQAPHVHAVLRRTVHRAGAGNAVVYAGGISAIRGMREMVEAIGQLPAELGATLELAGEFQSPAFRHELASFPSWDRVREHGYLDRTGVVELYRRSRLGLVLLHPRPNYLDALPVKLFEYMAAGLAVVASDFPLWRRIVEEAGCGVLVDPLDPDAIAAAVRDLLTNPDKAQQLGRNGRNAVEQRYHWSAEADKLLALYDRVEALGEAASAAGRSRVTPRGR